MKIITGNGGGCGREGWREPAEKGSEKGVCFWRESERERGKDRERETRVIKWSEQC